jgi:hypothetical protein
MGGRILSYDWPAHPLGDPVNWSAAVRTTVATALACRFPTVLWLGDQLRLIYNDGYIPILSCRPSSRHLHLPPGSERPMLLLV